MDYVKTTMDDEARECTACSSKPGSPTLCPACWHNRGLVGLLKERVRKLDGQVDAAVAAVSETASKLGYAQAEVDTLQRRCESTERVLRNLVAVIDGNCGETQPEDVDETASRAAASVRKLKAKHGAEAEAIRRGIEQLVREYVGDGENTGDLAGRVLRVLERVDAGEALVYLETLRSAERARDLATDMLAEARVQRGRALDRNSETARYAIDLQRMIEAHCRDEEVETAPSPHLGQMLNRHLKKVDNTG